MARQNAGKNVEHQGLSFIAGGKAKLYNHSARQFGGFLQNYTESYHTMQQSHSLVFYQMN